MTRTPAKNFQDLIIWQKAHKFVLSAYRLGEGFPKNEVYGLTSQLRRASVSIPADIVEGFRKKTKRDKFRFMNMAQGSREECRYYLILIKDLGYCNPFEPVSQREEISWILEVCSSSIVASRPSGSPKETDS
ncbi:MAG: four helix bundle protein [Nitrospirae bacterium]|nr:four helix bundle protein [Nitrospirota bacterium]